MCETRFTFARRSIRPVRFCARRTKPRALRHWESRDALRQSKLFGGSINRRPRSSRGGLLIARRRDATRPDPRHISVERHVNPSCGARTRERRAETPRNGKQMQTAFRSRGCICPVAAESRMILPLCHEYRTRGYN